MPIDPADPVLAVVAPPRLAAFWERAGLGADDALAADFSGWSKLVLLSADRAFLFPRDHTQLEYLWREIEALRAVAPLGLPEVPALLDVWDDREVAPYPVVVLPRLPGRLLADRIEDLSVEDVARVLEQLARLAARWHATDPGPLTDRPPRTHAPRALVDDLLGRLPMDQALAFVTGRLDLSAEERAVVAHTLTQARTLGPVLVHGDVHEGQVLVDSGLRVTGVLDWQTARVGHPFTEFDLGEWGTGTWRAHRAAFPELRRRQWAAYAAARGLADDLAGVFERFWAVVHALRWPDSVFLGADVTGTEAEVLETLHRTLA